MKNKDKEIFTNIDFINTDYIKTFAGSGDSESSFSWGDSSFCDDSRMEIMPGSGGIDNAGGVGGTSWSITTGGTSVYFGGGGGGAGATGAGGAGGVIYTVIDSTSTTITIDPYNELEELRKEQEHDEDLRSKHEALQDAYEEYQLIKKLVEDVESDKYVEDRYKVFKV